MKIGMMCLWNAANGPSIHAELVGRAWVKSGHQLKVFSAKKHPDARSTRQRDYLPKGYLRSFLKLRKELLRFRLFTKAKLPKIPSSTNLTGMLLSVLIGDTKITWLNLSRLKRST